MAMDMTYLLVRSTVLRTLHHMEHDHRRSIRNLVDLGEHLLHGRTQGEFMRQVQEMLRNPHSEYYALAQYAASHVSHTAMVDFGMNLGYRGLALGAKKIRSIEPGQGFHIPWLIALEYEADSLLSLSDVDSLFRQGKALGIHTYAVAVRTEQLESLAPVLRQHSDCAFLLFLSEGDATAPLALAAGMPHCMVILSMADHDAQFTRKCRLLAAHKCLFSAYLSYDENNTEKITQGSWVKSSTENGCVFCFFVAETPVSQRAANAVAQYAADTRAKQAHAILPVDFFADALYIDQAISAQPCLLHIDRDGYAHTVPQHAASASIRDLSLRDALRETMPSVLHREATASFSQ